MDPGLPRAAPTAAAALYLITTEVDAVHQRVRQAGAEIVTDPQLAEFGAGEATAYAFTTRDPEGNLWTTGAYTGAE